MDTALHSRLDGFAAAPVQHTFHRFAVVAATSAPRQKLSSQNRLQSTLADQERLKLSRDLHDSFLQDVTAALMQLRAAQQVLPADAQVTAEHLQRAIAIAEDTVLRMRQRVAALRRTSLSSLQKAPTEPAELCVSLHAHLAQLLRFSSVQLAFDGEQVIYLDESQLQEVLHIAGEAATNALKHGNPDCLRCVVRSTQDLISVTVSDNGGGWQRRTQRQAGFGMTGMQERAALLQGTLRISSVDCEGVTVCLQFASVCQLA